MEKQLFEICKEFNINGTPVYAKPINNGLINSSFEVAFLENGKIKKYMVQKINSYVFKRPEEVMENIIAVTGHIRDKVASKGGSSSRKTLSFKFANNGLPYVVDEKNEYWRVCDFIDNSITYNETNDLSVIKETGRAFGEFQGLLADFPAHDLNIIIPHFHNTINRYDNFENAILNNYSGRAESVISEIEDYYNLEDVATQMYKMQRRGELALKVTHNDTKCNNVLFDEKTHKNLCVIDLDTVMPGLVGFDFGDAIRFIASTASEDEKDLSKVELDINKFRAFAEGFLSKAKGGLTQAEIDTLALGAITMTTECGVRFLTDYIDGDKYFKTKYPDHNLDRARCQLKLAKSMVRSRGKMESIISELSKENVEEK